LAPAQGAEINFHIRAGFDFRQYVLVDLKVFLGDFDFFLNLKRLAAARIGDGRLVLRDRLLQYVDLIRAPCFWGAWRRKIGRWRGICRLVPSKTRVNDRQGTENYGRYSLHKILLSTFELLLISVYPTPFHNTMTAIIKGIRE